MTFDPQTPVFTGKFVFKSTNATGQKFYLSYTKAGNVTAPTVSSVSADETTVWTSYDAGGGSMVLVANNGMYLSVLAGNQLAILVDSASVASPVTLRSTGTADQVEWSWVDPTNSATLTGYYQLGTSLPTTLSFLSSGGAGLLAAFGLTVATPGLAAIQAAKSAAGLDLSAVNLTGADLTGLNCTTTHFDRAIMVGTELSGATLTGASLTSVDLTGIVWGQNISAASADFSDTIGVGMTVPTSGKGTRATFDSATFTGADWSGCDLTNASLHNAFVTGANFSGATLAGAYLYVLQAGKSNDGSVPGADFSHAYMPDVNLQSANLNGANLSHAQIYDYNNGASFLNANLTETDFSAADLSGAQFGGVASSIAGTNFDGAILFDASFDGVTLGISANGMPVTMVDASLENATFTSTAFSGVRMSGARVAVAVGNGAGVPLFAIGTNVTAYAASLDQSVLPADFIGASGVFAARGCDLSGNAVVAVISSGQSWSLTQSPVRAVPGIEDIGFTVVLASESLEVYTSSISLVEEGTGGITYTTTYTVTATALPAQSLSPDTRCPNRSTRATNEARGVSWQGMMTAPQLPLADLSDEARDR